MLARQRSPWTRSGHRSSTHASRSPALCRPPPADAPIRSTSRRIAERDAMRDETQRIDRRDSKSAMTSANSSVALREPRISISLATMCRASSGHVAFHPSETDDTSTRGDRSRARSDRSRRADGLDHDIWPLAFRVIREPLRNRRARAVAGIDGAKGLAPATISPRPDRVPARGLLDWLPPRSRRRRHRHSRSRVPSRPRRRVLASPRACQSKRARRARDDRRRAIPTCRAGLPAPPPAPQARRPAELPASGCCGTRSAGRVDMRRRRRSSCKG